MVYLPTRFFPFPMYPIMFGDYGGSFPGITTPGGRYGIARPRKQRLIQSDGQIIPNPNSTLVLQTVGNKYLIDYRLQQLMR